MKRLMAFGTLAASLWATQAAATTLSCVDGRVALLGWSGYARSADAVSSPNSPSITGRIGDRSVTITMRKADDRQRLELAQMRSQLVAAMMSGARVRFHSSLSLREVIAKCERPQAVVELAVEETSVETLAPQVFP